MGPIDDGGWPGEGGFDGYDGGDLPDYELVGNEQNALGDPLGADGFDPFHRDDGGDYPGTEPVDLTDDGGDDPTDPTGSVEDSYGDGYPDGDGAEESLGPAVTGEESIGPAVDLTDDGSAGGEAAGNGEGTEMVGSDPDPRPDDPAGSDWLTDLFPPELFLPDLPEPADGWPWSDVGSLGADLAAGDPLAGPPMLREIAVDIAELLSYAGDEPVGGGDPWAALAGSEDPATAALARWWRP